jgi:hypothetical protein
MKNLWNIPLGQRSVSPLHTQQREAGKESVASLDELLLCVKKKKGTEFSPAATKQSIIWCCRCFIAEFFFFGSCLLGQQQKSNAANIYRRGNLPAKR